MAKSGIGKTSETDRLRDEEREVETKAAYAGPKGEYGGKGEKTQKGTEPVEAQEYDPEYGDMETTSDRSLELASEAAEAAKEGGMDEGIETVE